MDDKCYTHKDSEDDQKQQPKIAEQEVNESALGSVVLVGLSFGLFCITDLALTLIPLMRLNVVLNSAGAFVPVMFTVGLHCAEVVSVSFLCAKIVVTLGTDVFIIGSMSRLILRLLTVIALVPMLFCIGLPVVRVIVAPACICLKAFATLCSTGAAVVVVSLVNALNVLYEILGGCLLLIEGVGESRAGGVGFATYLSTV